VGFWANVKKMLSGMELLARSAHKPVVKLVMFRFDPVDAFLSVGSTLLGKILLFFSAGMAGLALGWVAGYCGRWSVLLHPLGTVEKAVASGKAGEAFAWLFLWPLVSLGAAAQPWFFVFFALVVITVFAILVYSEEPPFLWWLILIAVTSLVPAMSDLSSWAMGSWAVLAVFWLGLGLGAIHFWRADYPGGTEISEKLRNDAKADTEEATPSDSKSDI